MISFGTLRPTRGRGVSITSVADDDEFGIRPHTQSGDVCSVNKKNINKKQKGQHRKIAWLTCVNRGGGVSTSQETQSLYQAGG